VPQVLPVAPTFHQTSNDRSQHHPELDAWHEQDAQTSPCQRIKPDNIRTGVSMLRQIDMSQPILVVLRRKADIVRKNWRRQAWLTCSTRRDGGPRLDPDRIGIGSGGDRDTIP
jgi:hypothetical protein